MTTPSHNSIVRRRCYSALAVLFWLAVWQIGSMALNEQILLVSPWAVLVRLSALVCTLPFWSSIGNSFLHIAGGFFAGFLAAILCAVVAARFAAVRQLLAPPVSVIKATPVASFIILALCFMSSKALSTFTSFLMVFPILYESVLEGIFGVDHKLLEMAQVFQLPPLKKLRYLYLPQLAPRLRAACTSALGLCWKAGVAAEVIGIPEGTIGEKLYNAKIYLDTPDLFAWTVVIILVSLLFEKLFVRLADVMLREVFR